jgi:hypothetical protein
VRNDEGNSFGDTSGSEQMRILRIQNVGYESLCSAIVVCYGDGFIRTIIDWTNYIIEYFINFMTYIVYIKFDSLNTVILSYHSTT